MNKYGPILYDDIDEDLYVFALFEKSMKQLTHFVPRSRFYVKNRLTNKKFFETSTLLKMLMTTSANYS